MAGLLVIGIAALQIGGEPATPAANSEWQLPAAPILPPPFYPTPLYPTPSSGSPATSGVSGPVRTRSEVPREPARHARVTASPTRRPTSPPPATPALRAGATIGLELAGAPGYRVRHRDFRGRADRIGPESTALSRADSRLIVRRGLADPECVSFEAANYPGWFLRHRNFEIRLDRAERSRLFAEDATFCPRGGSRAGVVALRSHNYPDRFLTESRSLLRLTPATTGTATQFVVRSPL
ncbi:AbfB domain-containing protein [Actinoplanes sp. NPDC049599]|uniref:AbfB domain-containing protein n=1 Tax=Actinoplanes sp. NPDC049599 TaxID=3363903 RepID=UPI003790632C